MSEVRLHSSTREGGQSLMSDAPATEQENVATRIVRYLKSIGTRHVFGVPSGDWLPYMEAMADNGVEFVLVANEASAGFMATVYGWMTGAPGACYGTFGPGATNLSTGVGCALLDRSPVLVFTSETPDAMAGRTTQMAIDNQAFLKPLTKWTTRLSSETIDEQLAHATHVATTDPPGPVHIGLPGSVGDARVPVSPVTAKVPAGIALPGEASIKAMLEASGKARRPVLAVGLTAHRLDMGEQISRVALRHRIPVVLTPMAKGLVSEDHPLYAGVLMHALSDQVARTYAEADLVIGVGYDPVEFNYEEWMPEVPLIHLDTVTADIDRDVYDRVLDVTGDPRESLRQFEDAGPVEYAWDLSELAGRREKLFADLEPSGDGFGALAVLSILRELLPEEGIMACDVGAHTHLIGQAWRTPHRFAQLMTNGWSSMGFGVPAAIAAKIARPSVPVVCVTGDGGFMMMAGEMATAKRLGLPVVFVVLRDQSLGLIRIKQAKRGRSTSDTVLLPTDGEETRCLFGVPVVRVSDPESYRGALSEALQSEGPVVIEANITGSDYDSSILRKHK